MEPTLVFFHLFGLMLGAAGGFSSSLIMRRAATLPADEAQVLRGLGPMLANVSAAGVALLWVTGLLLVWVKWGGVGNLPALFWVKMAFVLALTVAVGLIHKAYADIRRGDGTAARKLPRLGPLAGISSLVAVALAVAAFST